METEVRALFARYEALFNVGLRGEAKPADVTALYAPAFIGAAPAGVMTGTNDDAFAAVIAGGFDRYRAIGTRAMRIRHLRITPLDALHCVAHVAWTATYARPDLPETPIDFDVQYFVQVRDGRARVFGWVTGDEEAALRAHGIV